MKTRGVRGATVADKNSSSAIVSVTKELLTTMVTENDIAIEDIASVIFSTTHDLNAQFPAVAARELGWNNVPLLCTNEIKVRGSLKKCIRILVHWNTEKKQSDITHIYLRNAKTLRPDLP